MNLRRVVYSLVVGLLALYVIQFPEQAGRMVRTVADGLVVAGGSLVSFVGSMV